MIVAKYKFDSSVYSNLIPIFNDGYEGYTVSDETDNTNSNHIIRTIECDVLPTKIDFGVGGNEEQYTNRSDSLLAIYNLDTSAVTDGNRMFKGCRYMTEINTSNWDTSKVDSMNFMFYECTNLASLDVSNWDTSKVDSMSYMFYECTNLASLDVSNWDTSKVDSMSGMFQYCNNLTTLDVSNWDTSKVDSMSGMFYHCNKLTSLDVSNWDTKNVADMSAMFCDCTNLTIIDVSNFDTSNVEYMGWMFGGCQKLTSLDVSNFNTSNVTDMGGMFNSCYNLLSLDVSRWNTSNVTDMNNMFNFCYLLNNIDLSNWDTSNVKYVNGMFGRCGQMTMIDISNFDMSAIKTTNEDNYYHMFTKISNVKTLIFGNNKFPDDVDFIKLFGDDTPPSLEKVIVLEENTINKLTDILPDRSSELPGVIVTNATISDEAMNTISSKNWSIRKLVAQYKYDANTYEDLIPEFNTEFSSDKYEIYDSVSEIVIDNILCERGVLTDSLGTNATYNEETHSKTYRTKNYIPVMGNTTYHFSGWCHLYWYDANKKMIGEKIYFAGEASHLAPANAKYLRFYRGSGGYTNYSGPFILNDMTITAKLITRSIESVNGDLPTKMRFGDDTATDRELSLLEILDMNINEVTSLRQMFMYCENLTSITCDWNINNEVTSLRQMFYNCKSLTLVDVSRWDTSNVNNIRHIFYNCENLTQIDVSNWNTSLVDNMQYMFYDCNNLTSLDVSNFDTKNVTNMSNMFYNCTNLTELDVSNWDTSNVTDMSSLFHNCRKLTTLDVSRWNVDNVTRIDNLFNSCNELVSIDVSNWNTDNVQNMGCLFGWCYKLQSVDLSNWDTNKVTNMEYMFSECYELTSIGDTSNFDTSNATNMYAMFDGCFNLTSLDLSNFDTSNVTNMHSMFYNCSNLTLLDVSNFDTSNVTDMKGMFYNCKLLTELDVSNFDTSNVTNMQNMFNSCNNLTLLDVSNWDTSKVTDMGYMFYGCNNLTSLNVSNWDTSKVIDMTSMFANCYQLSSIDVSNWNTGNVTIMWNMFLSCSSLKDLSLGNGWVTTHRSKLNLESMFNNCINLVRLDMSQANLASWNITYGMFNWCYNLQVLDLGNFATSETSESTFSAMFNNTKAIKIIRCNNLNSLTKFTPYFVDRTGSEQGQIITDVELSDELMTALASKNWTVILSNTLTKVAEYVYDSKIWRSMIPTFNDEFIDYFIDDVEDENGLITRTISSLGGLPTKMMFGTPYIDVEYVEGSELALLEVLDMNTNNITDMSAMFRRCYNLTSINCIWNTSKVTNMYVMFYNCRKLASLDVSNWDTSNVTTMWSAFNNCYKLTELDVSNWDTSKVTNMRGIFSGCSKLTSLDLSNWDTSKVTEFTNMFSPTPLLTDIGMLYCTPSTINAIASTLPTTHTQTIWVKDTKPSECTVVSGIEFKEYKENSVMINLSSPLLDGDKIEVVDGKLCHYHKMRSIVLDGSEDENYRFSTYLVGLENLHRVYYLNDSYDSVVNSTLIKSNNFRTSDTTHTAGQNYECIGQNETYNASIQFNISKSKLSTQDIDGFKQWLSENPTTVVYELKEPYYEDITPLQSNLTLETYLECNLDIYTDLPIKTNLTYLTNIVNTSSIEEEINTINEGTDLTNLLEDEINN